MNVKTVTILSTNLAVKCVLFFCSVKFIINFSHIINTHNYVKRLTSLKIKFTNFQLIDVFNSLTSFLNNKDVNDTNNNYY